VDSLNRKLDVGWENALGVDRQRGASKPARPLGQERDAARDLAKARSPTRPHLASNEIRCHRQKTFRSRKMKDPGGEVEHRQHPAHRKPPVMAALRGRRFRVKS
jgi:hypothetical protein